jgi:hypothetical protein
MNKAKSLSIDLASRRSLALLRGGGFLNVHFLKNAIAFLSLDAAF